MRTCREQMHRSKVGFNLGLEPKAVCCGIETKTEIPSAGLFHTQLTQKCLAFKALNVAGSKGDIYIYFPMNV